MEPEHGGGSVESDRRIMTVAGKVVALAQVASVSTVRAHLAMRTRSPHGASPGAACAAGERGARVSDPPAFKPSRYF